MEHNHNIRIRIKKEEFKKKLGIEPPTKEELLSIIEPLIPEPIPGPQGKPGKPGPQGSPDTPEQIVEKIRKAPKGKKINYEDIEDTPDIMAMIRRETGKKYNHFLGEISDVAITDPQNNDVLQYNSTKKAWENKVISSGGGTWGSITGDQSVVNLSGFTNDSGFITASAIPTNVSAFTNDAGYITSAALTGYVPNTRTLTINGTAYDLSADRTWSVGTVTSVAALTLGTTGTDLSSTVATGTTTPVITLNVPTASASNRGALSSTDWSTFNSKESALTFSTGLTRTSNTITANLSTGVSGGQTAIGGTASGNNLTLSSTSNATKGKILFGTSGYDEVNNRLGIANSTPTYALDVTGDIRTSGVYRFASSPTIGVSGTSLQLNADLGAVVNANTTGTNLLTVSNAGVYGFTTGFVTGYTNPFTSLGAYRETGTQWRAYIGYPITIQNLGGDIVFTQDTGKTAPNVYTPTETVRFTSTGRVGIGTNAPSYKLSTVHTSTTAIDYVGQLRNDWSSTYVPILDMLAPNLTNGQQAYFSLGKDPSNNNRFGWSYNHVSNGSASNNMNFSAYGNAAGVGLTLTASGNVGIGTSTPTAKLQILAGTATASTAPLKFTSGTNLTTAEAGAFEYNGSSLYFTRSGTLRAGILMTDLATPFNTYTQSAKGATAFTSGTDNFLGGQLAGASLTAGSQNVLIGTQAGNLSNAGLLNAVFIGYFAGQSASGLATGSVFIGSQAGQNSAGATNSVFIGQLSGFSSLATNATFIGNTAGQFATNAVDTIGIGQNAANNATGSIESIYMGKNSGYNAVSTGITGDYNIALGTDTAKALTTGAGNTFIGYKVGDTVTTGSKNLLLGYDIDAQSNTADGQLSIQNAIFGTGNIGTGTTASTGNIGMYVVAPTARLHLPAGTTTANTAPLKLTSGTNMTTPENGAFEFDGTNLYFTVGGVRKTVTLT